MPSTYTTNLSAEEPGAGEQAGTWNSPVNNNMVILDAALGTLQQISLAGGSVSLSTDQTRSAVLAFIGALPGNVTVSIPSLSSAPATIISGRIFTVHNRCTNTNAFTVTIQGPVVGQQVVCAPPGVAVDIMMQGTGSSYAGSITYRNLPPVGSFMDYAGTAVPAWITGCTIPPYLNCDGTAFSSATYPALADLLGAATLPDSRGRFRATLNQTTGRITSGSSTGGVDGNTNFAAGGSQTTTLSSQNMPPVLITDPGHHHDATSSGAKFVTNASSVASVTIAAGPATFLVSSGITAVTGITAGNVAPNINNFSAIPPAYIAGLTLIRSA